MSSLIIHLQRGNLSCEFVLFTAVIQEEMPTDLALGLRLSLSSRAPEITDIRIKEA